MSEIVSYEIAQKLKEKGYPQHITDEAYIVDNYGEDECNIGDRLPIPLIPDYMDDVAAPTISQVLKWLREEHQIHIYTDIVSAGWVYNVLINVKKFEDGTWWYNGVKEEGYFDSYEQAALAGIEYTLDNLI